LNDEIDLLAAILSGIRQAREIRERVKAIEDKHPPAEIMNWKPAKKNAINHVNNLRDPRISWIVGCARKPL
jgi:hypothetical protein